MRFKDWGPASALAIAMEDEERRSRAKWLRVLECQMYGQGRIHTPYATPTYVLRRRATFGGRKGRRAVQRLRALGLQPVYMYLRTTTPMQHWTITL